ncbi:neurogenic locus notch homolog protein 1-like isoform X6 [Lytechinus variegatus]|uniref:neurogenic locus notch homolog protein 1-like isoform X6 n=1 Tax=Lytechinus variegatus TaxID=7654 RepID=UPI001BB27288|nr:neurogenic locus notch homolog protein 1-like isoform X6 [Lytechinus variegatus]
MTSQTNTFCILCITFLFATFHTVTSTSTPAAVLPPCASHPCENGGTCIEYTSAFQCRCTNDFTGLRCEIPVSNTASVCDDNPCAHGACVSSASDRFTCMCPGGWRGTACEIDVNECNGERGPNPCTNGTVCINEDGGYRCEAPCASPSPCLNGGSCSTRNTKPYYTCECMPNYEGETCDIVVETPCVKGPCQHGATCVHNQSTPLGFTCECTETYQGLLCENMIPPCSKEPCLNGATCQPDETASTGYQCLCDQGFEGLTCEVYVISPCSEDPCLNGGTCQPNDTASTGYQCLCDQGFEGPTCEIAVISPCTSNPCDNGGTCEAEGGALAEYNCICQKGYRGTQCEIVLHAVCTFEGVTYQEGSERKEDCNMCHCQQGSWHCTDKFCGEFMVSFAFANTNSNENDDDEEEFSNTLKEDIAEYFDINVNMIQVLTVSGNPAQVQFQLQDTLDSEVDIENVAADMLRQFVTGTYAFHYNQASYSINSRTVVIERRDSDNHANNLTHKDDGQQFISTTLLIVCIVVSTILVFAVLFGIAIIVVYKRRSRKEQIYCRKDKNTNASNNVAGGAIKYHKNVYNPVPPCPPARDVPVEVAEIRLQNGAGKHDVNINMEARV